MVVLGACVGAVMQDEVFTVRLDSHALFQLGAEPKATRPSARSGWKAASPLSCATSTRRASAVVQAAGADRIVSVAAVPVVTVSARDAQDNLTTVDGLAAQWAAAVDMALQRARERRLS